MNWSELKIKEGADGLLEFIFTPTDKECDPSFYVAKHEEDEEAERLARRKCRNCGDPVDLRWSDKFTNACEQADRYGMESLTEGQQTILEGQYCADCVERLDDCGDIIIEEPPIGWTGERLCIGCCSLIDQDEIDASEYLAERVDEINNEIGENGVDSLTEHEQNIYYGRLCANCAENSPMPPQDCPCVAGCPPIVDTHDQNGDRLIFWLESSPALREFEALAEKLTAEWNTYQKALRAYK